MNPVISVVIPVYNVANYLTICVDSILLQTFQDFEILLIDDGSSDGSETLCDKLADANEKIQVFHIQNSGPSKARNVGLDHAKGKFIYCMDSDDYLERDTFAKVVEEMEKGYDMVSFNFIREDANGKVLRHSAYKKQKMSFSNTDELFHFLCSSFLCYDVGWEGWSRFFRKGIIDKFRIRYCVDSKIGEDMAFCLCYMMHIISYQVLPEEFYHYIKRDGTLLGKSNETNNFPVIEKMALGVLEHMEQYCTEEVQRFYPTILMSFVEMEISRLRGGKVSESNIGEIAYKSLSKDSRKNLQSFTKEEVGKKLLGKGLFMKYRYDAILCATTGGQLKCLFAKMQYRLYYNMRSLYHKIK